MWQAIHNKLYYDKFSAQNEKDALVSAVLLTAQQYDASPPSTEKAALDELRTTLAGTKALQYVEEAFHAIVK